jgi:hypothetical protein
MDRSGQEISRLVVAVLYGVLTGNTSEPRAKLSVAFLQPPLCAKPFCGVLTTSFMRNWTQLVSDPLSFVA